MHVTDPPIDELMEFVRDLVLEDAGQETQIQFDIKFERGLVIQPAYLGRGMPEEIWFRFLDDGVMELFFAGEVWKAHFLLERIKTGKVEDQLGRNRAEEIIAAAEHRAAKRAEERDEEEFYDLLETFGDMKYNEGYKHGRASKLWARIKETINQ